MFAGLQPTARPGEKLVPSLCQGTGHEPVSGRAPGVPCGRRGRVAMEGRSGREPFGFRELASSAVMGTEVQGAGGWKATLGQEASTDGGRGRVTSWKWTVSVQPSTGTMEQGGPSAEGREAQKGACALRPLLPGYETHMMWAALSHNFSIMFSFLGRESHPKFGFNQLAQGFGASGQKQDSHPSTKMAALE